MTKDEVRVEKRYCNRIFQACDMEITTHFLYESDPIPVEVTDTFKCLTPKDCDECRACEKKCQVT